MNGCAENTVSGASLRSGLRTTKSGASCQEEETERAGASVTVALLATGGVEQHGGQEPFFLSPHRHGGAQLLLIAHVIAHVPSKCTQHEAGNTENKTTRKKNIGAKTKTTSRSDALRRGQSSPNNTTHGKL